MSKNQKREHKRTEVIFFNMFIIVLGKKKILSLIININIPLLFSFCFYQSNTSTLFNVSNSSIWLIRRNSHPIFIFLLLLLLVFVSKPLKTFICCSGGQQTFPRVKQWTLEDHLVSIPSPQLWLQCGSSHRRYVNWWCGSVPIKLYSQAQVAGWWVIICQAVDSILNFCFRVHRYQLASHCGRWLGSSQPAAPSPPPAPPRASCAAIFPARWPLLCFWLSMWCLY